MAPYFGHYQPAFAGQSILGGQQGAAAIAQLVLSSIPRGTHLGDAVGIGTGQQHAQDVTLRRPVKAGALLCREDVVLDESDATVACRAEMEAHFGAGSA